MQVKDGIYTFSLEFPLAEEIGVHQPGEDDGNTLGVHVVEANNSTILLGAGHETTADQIVQLARRYEVDICIAEHGDWDHYGGAPRLRDALGIELAVPQKDATAIRDDGVDPQHEFNGGDLQWGIRAIHAPGHTAGNMVFLHDDVLFAGDTLLGSGVGLVTEDDWQGKLALPPPTRNASGDRMAQESVAELLNYEFDSVLVTHGKNVIQNGRAAVRTVIEDLNNGIERAERPTYRDS